MLFFFNAYFTQHLRPDYRLHCIPCTMCHIRYTIIRAVSIGPDFFTKMETPNENVSFSDTHMHAFFLFTNLPHVSWVVWMNERMNEWTLPFFSFLFVRVCYQLAKREIMKLLFCMFFSKLAQVGDRPPSVSETYYTSLWQFLLCMCYIHIIGDSVVFFFLSICPVSSSDYERSRQPLVGQSVSINAGRNVWW